MNPKFWLERWQKNEIGFHAPKVQPALAKYWASLRLGKGATVFVPLCGKSIDMSWLAGQGHRVVGAELSELAVDQFFAEHGLTPSVRPVKSFKVKSADGIEIWCGDFFALDHTALPAFDAAYDRAALVAMPPEMQPRYAAKMAELMPAGSPALLVGLDYDPKEMQGPPFNVSQARVRDLFGPAFDISVIEAKDGLAKSDHLAKRGVTRLEEASYLLRRKAQNQAKNTT